MMQGVNVESTAELSAAIHIPVIASGGVTDENDIKRLCECDEEGIVGVIVGRALYEGTIDFQHAQKLADSYQE
jgi:phosphoribosylformimino-5-aminoimidazole carboxamide ribotide isomerase